MFGYSQRYTCICQEALLQYCRDKGNVCINILYFHQQTKLHQTSKRPATNVVDGFGVWLESIREHRDVVIQTPIKLSAQFAEEHGKSFSRRGRQRFLSFQTSFNKVYGGPPRVAPLSGVVRLLAPLYGLCISCIRMRKYPVADADGIFESVEIVVLDVVLHTLYKGFYVDGPFNTGQILHQNENLLWSGNMQL